MGMLHACAVAGSLWYWFEMIWSCICLVLFVETFDGESKNYKGRQAWVIRTINATSLQFLKLFEARGKWVIFRWRIQSDSWETPSSRQCLEYDKSWDTDYFRCIVPFLLFLSINLLLAHVGFHMERGIFLETQQRYYINNIHWPRQSCQSLAALSICHPKGVCSRLCWVEAGCRQRNLLVHMLF